MVQRNPHSQIGKYEIESYNQYSKNKKFYSNPLAYGKQWTPISEKINTFKGYLPQKIRSEECYISYDTPANQFIKFAFTYFIEICEILINSNKISDNNKIEIKYLLENLKVLLSINVLQDISKITYIPYNNQTLLRREGYRQILDIYHFIENSLSLSWEGLEDFLNASTKGIDVLYEYWIYIQIIDMLKKIGLEIKIFSSDPYSLISYSEDKLTIKLSGGEKTRTIFIDNEKKIRVHFYYNTTFNSNTISEKDENYSPLGGSYSRQFRPDYTLVILPELRDSNLNEDEFEKKCIESGSIAFLHFDAKYRLEKLNEVFQPDDTDFNIEKKLERNHIYKNADLYKMHTYNEAIRKTIGSYILYPGDISYKYSKYHEVLPGVGAFTMNPTQPTNDLETFLKDVINHQSNRFTQLYRMNYYIHDTLIKSTEIIKHSYVNYNIQTDYPPIDIFVLKVCIDSTNLDFNNEVMIFYLPAFINKVPQILPPNFHRVSISLIYLKDKNILFLGKISNLILNEDPSHSKEKSINNLYYKVSNINTLEVRPIERIESKPIFEVKTLYEVKDLLDKYFPEWQPQ